MSVIIDVDTCIGCNLCVPVCPNRAIAELENDDGAPLWLVKPNLCSECKGGYYETNQCVAVCPVDCITIDPAHNEGAAELEARGTRLGDYREEVGLPRNYAYTEAPGYPAAPGEFGPIPPEFQ